jgi:fucose 4-O-acetylase-like acetyltransferase
LSGKNRSIAIDLVRVIARVGVITRHTWYDPEGLVARIVCPGIIGIFFLLSGYFWSDRRSLADEIDTRASTLLVPYAAWMVLIGVPFYGWLALQSSLRESLPLAAAAAYGPQFASRALSVAWFFPTMFFALILLRWLAQRPRSWTWLLLAVILATTVITPQVFRYPPLAAGLALPCLVYLVGGQELRRLRPRITHPAAAGLALLTVSSLATFVTFGHWYGIAHDSAGTLIEIKASDFGFPVLGLVNGVLIGAGLILLAESCDRFIPAGLRQPVSNAAQTATFVMFFHPVLLFLLDPENDGGVVPFLVALTIPYLVARVLISRHWLPWLTGVPNRPAYRVSSWLRRREPQTA